MPGRLIEEMRSGAEPDTDPKDLTNKQILMLHQLLHAAKFNDPTGSHLSPAGLSLLVTSVLLSACSSLRNDTRVTMVLSIACCAKLAGEAGHAPCTNT